MAHYKEMVYHRGKKVSVDSLTAVIAQQRKTLQDGGTPCVPAAILFDRRITHGEANKHSRLLGHNTGIL